MAKTATVEAVRLQARARLKRASADHGTHDLIARRVERLEANGLDAKAGVVLDQHAPVGVGRSGEVDKASLLADQERTWLVDTLTAHPTVIAADASMRRTELADQAEALTLTLDLCKTIRAQNSAEKMLAAQLSALHKLAMQSAAIAASFADRALDLQGITPLQQRQIANVEAGRSTAAAARASEAFQRGMLTLDRLRSGGKQTIVVIHQHVTATDGAQVVVAGNMATGRKSD